jgi:hypothetical protein
VPVGGHRRFFGTNLAFGARFGVLGGRQGRQIQIQPEPIVAESVAQGLALSAKQGRTGLPQLLEVLIGKAIQCARQCRLIGERGPSPRPRQRSIGTQTSIHLPDSATAGQDADQHIQQLTGGGMIDRFERQVDRCQHRPQKVGAGQTVTQDPQWSKVGLVWHCHQSDNRAHRLPPQLVPAAVSILPHSAQMVVVVCYPRNFAQN